MKGRPGRTATRLGQVPAGEHAVASMKGGSGRNGDTYTCTTSAWRWPRSLDEGPLRQQRLTRMNPDFLDQFGPQ